MKALVLEEYMKFGYRDVPDAALRGPRDVLVRIRACAICGSDVHGMDGSTGRRVPPVIMGHEAAGEIVEAGPEVRRYRVGDRVTFDSTEYCGECWHCRRGEVNLCDDRRVLGVSCAEYRRDRAFAEYVVVPDRILYPLPDGLDFVSAALTEPLAVAAHALSITPIGLGEDIAVVGTGLIGLLLIQVLRSSCAGKIMALDTDPDRRASALAFGADHAFDPLDAGTNDGIKNLTHGRGVDRAFEAVGATAPIATALGTDASPSVELPLQQVVTRQLTLFGSCAISGEYPLALDLMARGKVDVKALLSATAPLSQGASWFDRLYRRESGLLKVVLQP
ncbi:MAG: galactitol-1-phosphate 5-dehydrogenase [Spirochaetae bacterium HGW-Spirochaetae-7]|nr:MAG: galactitol-1-phosphate 5-dehydrogenase [Spirochaetae bacterium HGW-Spirochaetae-7]